MDEIEKSTDIFVWYNYTQNKYQVGNANEFVASGENLNEVNDFLPILRFKPEKNHVATLITKELNDSITKTDTL